MKTPIKSCIVCGKEFAKAYSTSRLSWKKQKSCSPKCANLSRRGRRAWNSGIKTGIIPRSAFKKGQRASPGTEFKKGQEAWNEGLKGDQYLSQEAKDKMAVWKGKVGAETPAWKGEKAGYAAIHVYLVAHHGHHKKCERCGVKGEYILSKNGRKRWSIDWANRTGNYTRDPKDYFGLCRTCHNQHDKGLW